MNRDFKGVWIPKEIWLNTELTLLEKVILIEIDSLDNEDNCTAGNEYLANFCQCSERKISEAISKLVSLGFIEIISFNGRNRKLKSLMRARSLNSMQSSKNCEADLQNLRANNIDNNNIHTNTNVLVSTEADEQNFLIQEPTTVKKPKKNLYAKCMDAIDEFTDDEEVRSKLKEFLEVRLERKDTPLGIKAFEAILKKLRTLTESKAECLKIIQQSIDRSYLSFFPLMNRQTYKKKTGKDVEIMTLQGDAVKVSDVEKEEMRRLVESGEIEEY